MEDLELIRKSFEEWYNSGVIEKKNKVSIVLSYSDEQSLLIKSYHKVSLRMIAVGIKNHMSYTFPFVNLTEHYNHGVTGEEDARVSITKKLLHSLYAFGR
jgi:hypothetical protein